MYSVYYLSSLISVHSSSGKAFKTRRTLKTWNTTRQLAHEDSLHTISLSLFSLSRLPTTQDQSNVQKRLRSSNRSVPSLPRTLPSPLRDITHPLTYTFVSEVLFTKRCFDSDSCQRNALSKNRDYTVRFARCTHALHTKEFFKPSTYR